MTQDQLFSPDWFTAAAEAFDAGAMSDGPPVHIGVTLLGGPDGDVDSGWTITSSGVEFSPKVDPQADAVLTIPWNDAMAVIRGELLPAVAYMQGRLKASGDMALVLQLLEWSATPGFESWRGRVA